MRKKILFVCIENSNRSQMAQAFAVIHGKEKVESLSAGSMPSGNINPLAIEAMKELGYDLSAHQSKSLNEIPKERFEYVVTMGCRDACPWVPANHHIDWNIPDPRNLEMKEFRGVRDLIKQRVLNLLDNI